jgi:hypothetical protein
MDGERADLECDRVRSDIDHVGPSVRAVSGDRASPASKLAWPISVPAYTGPRMTSSLVADSLAGR